jgi:hypothetical protein
VQSFKTRRIQKPLAHLRAMLTRVTALIQLKDVPVALPVNVLKGLKKAESGANILNFKEIRCCRSGGFCAHPTPNRSTLA